MGFAQAMRAYSKSGRPYKTPSIGAKGWKIIGLNVLDSGDVILKLDGDVSEIVKDCERDFSKRNAYSLALADFSKSKFGRISEINDHEILVMKSEYSSSYDNTYQLESDLRHI